MHEGILKVPHSSTDSIGDKWVDGHMTCQPRLGEKFNIILSTFIHELQLFSVHTNCGNYPFGVPYLGGKG